MRKIYLFLLLLLAGTGSLLAQAPTPELIWYKFDSTGTVVPNFATNPPTGTATATLMGGLTQNANGICNGSVMGSGVSASTDYVNTNWATNLGTGSWTIAWRAQGISTNGTLYYIFGDGTSNSFRCFTNGVAGSTNWIIRGGGLTDTYINGGALSTPTSCAYVYDQSLNQIRAYLNGVLVSTVAQTAPNVTGTGPFKVVGYNTNVGAPAGGMLDDFRVYNRALTPQEVMSIVTGTSYTGFLGADQQICPGDSISLSTSPYNTTTTTWSTGATTDSIYADSAGTYYVNWSSTCELGMDTINITAAPAPLAPGFAGMDDTICTGDTVMLSVSTSEPLLWSNGDTTATTWISAPGTYTVTVNQYCATSMDTVTIVQSALVYSGFVVADTTGGCEGDTINLGSTGMYSSYLWSTGDSTASTWVTGGGTYYLNVMDACGAGMDSVVISPFITQVNASFTSSVNMMDATFTNTSSGGGNLQFSWNFGDTGSSNSASPIHTYAANGTYLVTMTVSNECFSETVTDTVVINFIGVANPTNMVVNVFPNPAKDRVVVTSEFDAAQDVRVSLVSLMGQVMFQNDYSSVSGSFRQTLDLSTLARGVYFLQVEGASGKYVSRLVVE
ncbi:MAG: T9SS type A sorting domain-containing protein [Bacteroidia bacterium]